MILQIHNAEHFSWSRAGMLGEHSEGGRRDDGLKSLFANILVQSCQDWATFRLAESPNSRPTPQEHHSSGCGKPSMQSQFASLEKPKNAIIIDARNPLDEVIDRVVKAI
jgi:gluconate kinase